MLVFRRYTLKNVVKLINPTFHGSSTSLFKFFNCLLQNAEHFSSIPDDAGID